MSKNSDLKRIASQIEKCRTCRSGKIGKAVPGEGNSEADIMFIGEAPGKKEAESGRPFVGRSGQLLRRLIRDTGLKEDEVFITSPVKFLPKKGTPSPKDIKHGKKHLEAQISIINPQIIVLLGSVACRAVLDKKFQVLKDHGKIINRNDKSYLITIHPAAVIRFPKYSEVIKSDFRKLKKFKSG